jgi:hypothetical protein
MLKKIFIPGWMDTADSHVDYAGLEIWKNKINPSDKIEAEYVVGHSLGANFALINWNCHRDTKLILVNPLVPQRNVFFWLLRWVMFLFTEGTPLNEKRLTTFPHIINGVRIGFSLLADDLMDVLGRVPRENLVIIRGKEDEYFFGKEIASALKAEGVKIVEVENAGHGWNENFNNEISKLIN